MTAIKDARAKSGFTQRRASEISGIPLGTLRRWEQGINEPDIDSIILLADIYGVSTDVLLGNPTADGFDSTKLRDDERELINLYRSCTTQGREYLLGVVRVTAGIFSAGE